MMFVYEVSLPIKEDIIKIENTSWYKLSNTNYKNAEFGLGSMEGLWFGTLDKLKTKNAEIYFKRKEFVADF